MRKVHFAFAIALVVGCSSGSEESGGTMDVPDSGADTSSGDVAVDTGAVDTAIVDADAGDGFVPCKGASDCATSESGKACDTTTGKCVPCTASSDLCSPSEHCDVATSKCVAGCKSDEGCATTAGDAGVDGGDAGDGGVSSKSRCDVASHSCVECTKDEHCAPGFLCVGNVCSKGCSSTKPCATGESCCDGACVDVKTNSDNCGACGTKCTSTTGTATCTDGACSIASCTGTLADCDKSYANGCEVDTATSTASCGACGNVCGAVANGTAACVASACAVGSCSTGFADCDKNVTNGCEVNTQNNVSNCGACGNVCPTPANAAAACASGSCALGACNTGFADCDTNPANGCEVNTQSDVSNCGGCGNVCTLGNATAACASGSCAVASCNSGFANCDANPTNGCEVDTTNNPNNCGGCGVVCSLPNATAGCSASACTVASCNVNFANCDGNPTNGCEVDTTTDPNNCGGCGSVCATGASCTAGTCQIATSCAQVHTRLPSAPSGKYTIDPDGAGGSAPFDVYCDMTSDGGGWTLVMKLDGTKTTFAYSAAYWSNTTTLNPTSTDMTQTEAKLASYNLVPGTELRVGMVDAGTTRYLKVPLATVATTLYSRLSGGTLSLTALGRSAWYTLLASPSLQLNCNREGFNNAVTSFASVRIGILGNQEADCGSPDSFIGFGAGSVACNGGITATTGNGASCSPDNGDRNTATFGYIFIR